jgi:type I restriction enzyme S subunit
VIFKPLDLAAKIIAGQSPESSTYNSVGDGLPFFQGKADFQDMYPKVRMWCKSAKRKEAAPGDILISVRAPVGAVNICNQNSIIGRGLSAIRPSSILDGKFLYYYLKANEKQIDALGTGSTFKAITQDTLKKILIPLPPLNDQIRIAHLLSKVEGLIAQRKKHLQQLDNLLKSVFLEMFGDPVWNEKGWDLIFWDDLFSTRTGKLNANAMSENGSYPFFTCAKEIFRIDNFDFDCEALILAGNNATGDYDVKYYAGKFNAYQRTYILELRKGIDSYLFYKHHLEMKLRQLKEGSKGANTQYLTKRFLDTLFFLHPNGSYQKKFAAIAKKIESLKSHYQKSLTDLESLYGVLSQKAFKGQLDLSRVPLPISPDESQPTTVCEESQELIGEEG